MTTSNLDPFMVSQLGSDKDNPKLSDIQYHHCNSSSSSSQTPYAPSISDSQEDQNLNLMSGALKIQAPSSTGEFKVSNGTEDDPKTPRSKKHRIPVTAACPPAPRKARRVPVNGKRKPETTGPFFPVVRVPADFIVYVDAMLALNEAVFVPDIVVGDLGTGDRAKKLKL